MAYRLSDDQNYPRITQAVQWIVVINVVIAFMQVTIVSPNGIMQLLGFHQSTFVTHWWTPITYMFVHAGALHLILNMYMLWMFGCRLEYSWSPAAFTRFYLWSGLGGVAGHLLMGGNGVLVGASGAIMGVMLGYAVAWPEDEVFLFGIVPMKVKWLIPLFIAINLFSGLLTLGASGGVAYFAHLGGLAFGWIYLRLSASDGLERLRNRISPVPDEVDEPPRAVPRSLPRNREKMSEIDEIVARSNAIAARRQNAVLPRQKVEGGTEQAEALNLVLDKISERGLESLTSAEWKLLEEMSRKMRLED